MWFLGAEQSLPVYSSQRGYFTAHIHLSFFPITQPPSYFVLDNTDFPQLSPKQLCCHCKDWDLFLSRWHSRAWGHWRVGATLSTDSCSRWPFDLAAELMPRPFPPLSSSYLCYSSLSQHWLSSCVANSTPKVLTPLRCTLGPRCCLHCPQPLSYTLAFLGHAYFKGPYSSIVSLCRFWAWGRALHPVLLPIGKNHRFYEFPIAWFWDQ